MNGLRLGIGMTGNATTVSTVSNFLEEFAPLALAESWDNVGLLIGNGTRSVSRMMTCLTLTVDVAEEAIRENVDMVVSHHPLMFRAVQKITNSTAAGAMLLELIENQIAVYSPHTAFDSAKNGINQQLADRFALQNVLPIRSEEDAPLGSGRWGRLEQPMQLSECLDQIRSALGAEHLQYVGDPDCKVQSIAIACGAAGEYLMDAIELNCDLFVTGETRFHTLLDARTNGIAMVLLGHYSSERPSVEQLAHVLNEQFPTVDCFASRDESDPLKWNINR